MEDDVDSGDVFRIPDLWGVSPYLRDTQESSSFLFSGLRCEGIDEKLATAFPKHQFNDGFFGLPDLSLGFQGEVSTPPSTPTESVDDEELSRIDEGTLEEAEEIWMSSTEGPLKRATNLSWDDFEGQAYEEPHTAYITEAGPQVFDAALASYSDVLHIGTTENLVYKSLTCASSLLALGLGRSSVLFSWDEGTRSFVKTSNSIRISGCTGEMTDGLLAIFMNCGNATRALKLFYDQTYQAHTSPGRIALADAVSTVISTVQSRLTIPASKLNSFLNLQVLFKPIEEVLTSFYLIVQSVSSAANDEAMVSQLFYEVQRLEHRTDSTREIVLEVLARVSRPFLDFLGEWIGTQRESGVPLEKGGSGKSFVKVEDRLWIDEQGLEVQEPDFIMDKSLIPSFLPLEDANTMFETGKNLRFLRTHHSNHPLARTDVILSASPPMLEWKFSWQCIEKLEAKALKYEKDLVEAIKKHSKSQLSLHSRRIDGQDDESPKSHLDIFGKSDEEMEARILKSISDLDQPLAVPENKDQLSKILNNTLSGNTQSMLDEDVFTPPISLIPILSFSSIIAAQARIVNVATMRLFFHAHNLREHLNMQRRFQLLGDGVFSSRLSHALFDPELETAERRAGMARTGGIMGLRLEGRDSWPPASSELRLALMSVLTESYQSRVPYDTHALPAHHLDRKGELPGDLSFAVRDMSEAEIERCKDPGSIEALDFLRLSYKPPSPLSAVITPLALHKYDILFKLLLRVTRMHFVVARLFRDAHTHQRSRTPHHADVIAHRFRIEAHHFITCLCGYYFDTGIDAPWRLFDRKIDRLEARLASDDDEDSGPILGPDEGVDALRAFHERLLDHVMAALLLRKRQQPVMKLLEEIFGSILLFARHSRGVVGSDHGDGQDLRVEELSKIFRRKVDVFMNVCRGLGEKKGFVERKAGMTGRSGLFHVEEFAGGESTIVQLLARLEISDYYSRPVKV